MYLGTWWLPLEAKACRVAQTFSVCQTLQNSEFPSLESHLYRQCLLRKFPSTLSSKKSHWGARFVIPLLMAWSHNQRLSLHKDGEWVPPIFLIKAIVIICWDGAAQHHLDSPTPIRYILQSWVPAILCASIYHLLSSHCTPQSVWALPAEVLA